MYNLILHCAQAHCEPDAIDSIEHLRHALQSCIDDAVSYMAVSATGKGQGRDVARYEWHMPVRVL